MCFVSYAMNISGKAKNVYVSFKKMKLQVQKKTVFCEVCEWNQDLEMSCVFYEMLMGPSCKGNQHSLQSLDSFERVCVSVRVRKVLLYELFAYAFPANESNNLSKLPSIF